MGLTRFGDIPGNVIGFQALVASAASNGTGGEQLVRCPQAGYLNSAGIAYTASQNSATASNGKTVKIINLGSAAAGTAVLASYTIPTSTAAALTGKAFTVGAASVATFAAGDILQYVVAPGTTENVTYAAGLVTLELSYT